MPKFVTRFFCYSIFLRAVYHAIGKKMTYAVDWGELSSILLHAELASVQDRPQRDLERDDAGGLLLHACENTYTPAAKELIGPWLFPATQYTSRQKTGKYRRYHRHGTPVPKAMKQAVGQASMCKRASAQTFRHSFASHVRQANDAIRTIQE